MKRVAVNRVKNLLCSQKGAIIPHVPWSGGFLRLLLELGCEGAVSSQHDVVRFQFPGEITSSLSVVDAHFDVDPVVDVSVDLLQPVTDEGGRSHDQGGLTPPVDPGSRIQVWPLTQLYFVFALCKKSLICLEGISMTPHRGDTILFRSS